MAARLSLPNLVTMVRAALIFGVVLAAYGDNWWTSAVAGVLALLIIAGDWLDGHLARRLNQSSALGSVLDVAADRMLETVLWIVLADLDVIPVWIPIVVISRGILTDTIRGYALRHRFSHPTARNRVSASVTGITTATTVASRHDRVIHIKRITAMVAE